MLNGKWGCIGVIWNGLGNVRAYITAKNHKYLLRSNSGIIILLVSPVITPTVVPR